MIWISCGNKNVSIITILLHSNILCFGDSLGSSRLFRLASMPMVKNKTSIGCHNLILKNKIALTLLSVSSIWLSPFRITTWKDVMSNVNLVLAELILGNVCYGCMFWKSYSQKTQAHLSYTAISTSGSNRCIQMQVEAAKHSIVTWILEVEADTECM